jgi:subtilisin family serine protease
LRRRKLGVLALLAWVIATLVLAGSAGAARYVVIYDRQSVPADAAERIARAGGRLVAEYDQIGVAVAESGDEAFADRVGRDKRVRAVSRDEPIAAVDPEDELAAEGDLPNEPATDADTFSPLQWNMRQIHAPEAHAITGGSPAVEVAVIDTGIEPTHPDLINNLDPSKSTSCVPQSQPPLNPAWRDDNGHGTHNAGTIAAESNGIGIVGVAPNVKVAAVKAGNAANQFFAAPVICAFEWVAAHRFDVANASFNVDGPVFSYCHTNRAQQILWKAVKRSVQHALRAGVTVVASAGNNGLDITHPDYDGDGDIDNECVRSPSELPGVITVAATGIEDRRASYSNFGMGYIDVAAPGGDPAQVAGPPPFNVAPINVVLSTWPAALFSPTIICDPLGGSRFPPFPPSPACPREAPGTAYYRYMAGTSVSAAHVSGLAALVISRYGDADTLQNGKLRPGQVEAIIEQTADPKPCPPDPTTCQGGEDYNSWYGHGRVNALSAVTLAGS